MLAQTQHCQPHPQWHHALHPPRVFETLSHVRRAHHHHHHFLDGRCRCTSYYYRFLASPPFDQSFLKHQRGQLKQASCRPSCLRLLLCCQICPARYICLSAWLDSRISLCLSAWLDGRISKPGRRRWRKRLSERLRGRGGEREDESVLVMVIKHQEHHLHYHTLQAVAIGT